MGLIIETLKNNDNTLVATIGSDKFAYEVYHTLKREDEQLAIYFLEQYRYFKFTGRLMVA